MTLNVVPVAKLSPQERNVLSVLTSQGQTAAEVAAKTKLPVGKAMQYLGTLTALKLCVCVQARRINSSHLYQV